MCVYICIHVCAHKHMCIYTLEPGLMLSSSFDNACQACVCVYKYMCVYICIHVCAHNVYIYIGAGADAQYLFRSYSQGVRVCVCVYVYVCIYILTSMGT